MLEKSIKNNLVYHGKVNAIFKIFLVNLFLKIFTLGVYGFWGKTYLRQYIYHNFILLKDRFEYTGTGIELFLGFLKGILIFILLYVPLMIYPPELYPISSIIFIFIYFFFHLGKYFKHKYLLSRTNWRGIRGHLTGSAIDYAFLNMLRSLLNIISLGILIPYSDIKIQKYITEHTYFGSEKASFVPQENNLMRIHLVTAFSAPFTLFMSRFWYQAALIRYIFQCQKISNLTFEAKHTGFGMLKLGIGNFFIILLTFGFGQCFVIQRNMKFLANNLVIIGDIATSSIFQSDELLKKTGESLDFLLSDSDGFL